MTNQISPRQPIPYLKEMLGYRYWPFKWHRRQPAARAGAISLNAQGPGILSAYDLRAVSLVFLKQHVHLAARGRQRVQSTRLNADEKKKAQSSLKTVFMLLFLCGGGRCIVSGYWVNISVVSVPTEPAKWGGAKTSKRRCFVWCFCGIFHAPASDI